MPADVISCVCGEDAPSVDFVFLAEPVPFFRITSSKVCGYRRSSNFFDSNVNVNALAVWVKSIRISTRLFPAMCQECSVEVKVSACVYTDKLGKVSARNAVLGLVATNKVSARNAVLV